MTEGCVETAGLLARSDRPRPRWEPPSAEELEEGLQRHRIRNVVAARRDDGGSRRRGGGSTDSHSSLLHRKYEKLVNDLLDCLEDRDL